ncbi:MAG: mannose-1-phosphate guanylyltransferase [Acidobacteriota bacterium]|nr:mannose-1-phosphate guanylyltransferase [Acidobacteriota bacterium]
MRVILLAGGGGTRLWPLSTDATPKQFLALLSGRSLLADTAARIEPLTREIYVATSERHAARVREELPSVPAERILAEPCRRNSGPAVLSAAIAFARDGDPLTAAVPSDQTVADAAAFRASLSSAAEGADTASVVVLGVPPTRPETDFGYLDVRPDAKSASLSVLRFVEKPDTAQAEELVRLGCLWNAGIFVFRPSRFLAEARRVSPDLVAAVERYEAARVSGDRAGASAAYEALPDISIDYAVMEKAAKVRAVPLRAGWSDAGTWRAVRELKGASDAHGNLVISDQPVLAPGISNSAIVIGPEGVLVMPFDRERELKAAVEALRREQAGEKSR